MFKRTTRIQDEGGQSGVGGTYVCGTVTVQQLSRTSEAQNRLIWQNCRIHVLSHFISTKLELFANNATLLLSSFQVHRYTNAMVDGHMPPSPNKRLSNICRTTTRTPPHEVFESSQPREQQRCTKRPTTLIYEATPTTTQPRNAAKPSHGLVTCQFRQTHQINRTKSLRWTDTDKYTEVISVRQIKKH